MTEQTEQTEQIRIPVNSNGLVLEGVLGSGERGAGVIAPPHPLYGGRLDNPVVLEVARGLARAGLAVLRFNFRGGGASTGSASGSAHDADDDYGAAFEFLACQLAGPYLCAGYSFGAAAAVRVAGQESRVAGLILIAPPLAMLDMEALRAFGGPVTIVLGDDDSYSPLADVEQALAPLPNVQLQVITGADHFFSEGGLDQLAALAERAAAG